MIPKTKGITSADIVAALHVEHERGRNPDLCFEELRLSSGFENESRVDFLAMNVAPSTGNLTTAYEVKITRQDFRRETYQKQRGARLFSDKFYFIAPKGVIPHDEVPDWAGLIEVEWTVYKGKPRLRMLKTIPAPKRDKEVPSWGLIVSMVRNARKADSPPTKDSLFA